MLFYLSPNLPFPSASVALAVLFLPASVSLFSFDLLLLLSSLAVLFLPASVAVAVLFLPVSVAAFGFLDHLMHGAVKSIRFIC